MTLPSGGGDSRGEPETHSRSDTEPEQSTFPSRLGNFFTTLRL